jgi:hypothetical protein
MPVNPYNSRYLRLSNIAVSAAGPLSNLGLAILAVVVMRLITDLNIAGIVSLKFFIPHGLLELGDLFIQAFTDSPLDGFSIVSELFPAFKPLQASPYALVLFMILYSTGIGSGLYWVSASIIRAVMNS